MNFITGYVIGARMLGKKTGMQASADAFAAPLTSDVDKLVDRIDRLAMVMECMWSLLEENGYTRDQLIAKIEEMDSRDGSTDGRIVRAPIRCPKCESAVSAGSALCQFCGWQNPDVDPLATL